MSAFETILGGFVVGFLTGLTGMGGGSLMTPLMLFVFHLNPTVAVGTDLLYSAATKVAGAVQHVRQKTVNFAVFKYLAYGSVLGAALGSVAVGLMEHDLPMPTVNATIQHALAVVYIFVLSTLIMRWFLLPRRQRAIPQANVKIPKWKLMGWGCAAGVIVGFTSIGSGSLYMALLTLIYPLSTVELVGIDILLGVVITAIAGLIHMALGNVKLEITGLLLVGSIPGILLGSSLAARVPEWVLRVCIVLILSWSTVNLLTK